MIKKEYGIDLVSLDKLNKKSTRTPDSLVLREGNISLILDSYDDIFSDFDPRSYSEKALSDDFVNECKRASLDKQEGFEFRLLVPKSRRKINDEVKIKKRLRDHFKKHYDEMENDVRKIKISGYILIMFGMIMMFLAYLLYSERFPISDMITNILLVITEPGGWFLFWIGGEKLVYGLKDKKPSYEFYKKMSTAKIYFFEY